MESIGALRENRRRTWTGEHRVLRSNGDTTSLSLKIDGCDADVQISHNVIINAFSRGHT